MCLLRGTDWVFKYDSGWFRLLKQLNKMTNDNCAVRTASLYIIQVMCFVWIWEQTAIISLYSINWLVCITEIDCVYCAVQTGHLNLIQLYVSVCINNWTYLLHCYTNNIAPISYFRILNSYVTLQPSLHISCTYLHMWSAHTPQNSGNQKCESWKQHNRSSATVRMS